MRCLHNLQKIYDYKKNYFINLSAKTSREELDSPSYKSIKETYIIYVPSLICKFVIVRSLQSHSTIKTFSYFNFQFKNILLNCGSVVDHKIWLHTHVFTLNKVIQYNRGNRAQVQAQRNNPGTCSESLPSPDTLTGFPTRDLSLVIK